MSNYQSLFSDFMSLSDDNPQHVLQSGMALLPRIKKEKNTGSLASVYYKMGLAHLYLGKYESALHSLKEARYIHEEKKLHKEVHLDDLAIAGTYILSGQQKTGIEMFFAIQEKASEANLHDVEELAWYHLGKLYAERGLTSQGMTFLSSALELNEITENQDCKVNILLEMGRIEMYRNNISKASALIDESARIGKENSHFFSYNSTLAQAELYSRTERWQQAEDLLNRTLLHCRKNEITRGEILTLYQLGLLLESQEQTERALEYFSQCFKKSGTYSFHQLKIKSGDALSRLYRKKGELETALNYLEEVRQLEREVLADNSGMKADIWNQNRKINRLEEEMASWKQYSEHLKQIHYEKEEVIRELRAVSEIAKKITSSLNPNDIAEILHNQLRRFLDLQSLYIGLYNRENNELDIRYLFKLDEQLKSIKMQIHHGKSLAYWVIHHNEDIIVNSREEAYAYTNSSLGLFNNNNIQSCIIVRLQIEGQIIGLMGIASLQKNRYMDRHLQILQALAGFLAVALSNAETHQNLITANEKIAYIASHDSLTGLPNRARIIERLNQELVRCRRYDTALAVLFIDLDGFKNINDNCGHRAGDELLKRISSSLSQKIRATDAVGRLAGDEFLVILTDNCTPDKGTRLAKQILKNISKPFIYEKNTLQVTASIGVSFYPNDGRDSETLINAADEAMYRAKTAGKNKISTLADTKQL